MPEFLRDSSGIRLQPCPGERSSPFLFLLLLTAAILPAQTTTVIAGTGIAGLSADNIPAATAQINNPYGLATGPDGALYFCEIGNHRIRRIDLKTHLITTVAGTGKKGYTGDGGPALQADLNEPYEVAFDRDGNLYFAEMQNHVVRRIDAKTRFINTIAGTGTAGFIGDGGPAIAAELRQPHSIAFDPQGRLLICDIGNSRIRRLDLATGKIETWAGTGERKPTPDGAPLAGTPLNGPRAIAIDPAGNLYLALREGNAIYRIDPKSARIFHLAGTGETGHTGDGGPANLAKLAGPKGIAWAPGNTLYLADTESHTIRKIDLKTNIITTVAGTGERGELARPHGIFVTPQGAIYIADSENHRILQLK